MAEAPTAEELGPLIGDSASLDDPAKPDPAANTSAFEAHAVAAVGTRARASALKDAITECLRENGLLGGAEPAGDPEEAEEDPLEGLGDLGDETEY